jgi:hypothetical protein
VKALARQGLGIQKSSRVVEPVNFVSYALWHFGPLNVQALGCDDPAQSESWANGFKMVSRQWRSLQYG